MGKSPGKWFKSFLLGKKTSKSNLSKGKDIAKSASKKEVLVSSKTAVPDTCVGLPLVSSPAPGLDARNEVDSKCGPGANLSIEGVTSLCTKEVGNAEKVTNFDSQQDPEKLRHETAAIKAQAAVRGYLARCAFQRLKGIVRLQAVSRGHLVRKQAVVTLCCVRAIVKFQALARGQKVRRSTIGIEVQNACNLGKIQGAKCSDSSRICTSALAVENVFARKLLALSSTTIPLCLQYGPEEPNSAWEWLERWTRSQIWVSHSQMKKNIDSVSQTKHGSFERVGTENGRPKKGFLKASSSNSESDKPKHNPRKISSRPIGYVNEHPQNELEKVKYRRKTSDSKKQAGERFEGDNGKPKSGSRKGTTNTAPEVSEEGTNDSDVKKKEVAEGVSKLPEVDLSLKLPSEYDQAVALDDHPHFDLQPTENNTKPEDVQRDNKQLNPSDNHISNENQKTSERRASLPANIEHQENGVRTMRKVPSYMAPTESAKAKLRGQGSLRFSEDAIEKYDLTRRHSLPSSINGKLISMSPRVQRLVHSASKGSIRSDRSLSSSRDGLDKVTKPEWRR